MKATVGICLLAILLLFSACHVSGGLPGPEQKNASDVIEAPANEQEETRGSVKMTRDQAIQIIRNISDSAGNVQINSYPELDKVVEDVRYYYLQVVFGSKMSAVYYVDENEGNVFIAMGGELDTENPLPDTGPDEDGKASGLPEITVPETAAMQDVFDTLGMTGEQVEQKYGNGYKRIFVNYDGCMEAFLYSEKGLTVAFGSGGTVACVYCTDKIEINGASSGMDFSQIQEKLGETGLRQTWAETPIDAAYEIAYGYNGRTVVFISRQEEGNDSVMGIR